MTQRDFLKILEELRKVDKFMDKAHDLGIDLMDSPICSSADIVAGVCFNNIYGQEGLDWIEWYLYEEHSESGPSAWEADGTPIDFSTDEKLWEYLEKNYNKEKREEKE